MAKPKINFDDITTTEVDDDALFTFTSGETLLNFGNLTTTGDLANGIFAGADDVTIRHFGNIATSGLGAAGIYVQGDNARIENFGSVHTTGTFTADELFFAEGIFAEGNRYHIVNHGSVRVEGLGSSALVGFAPEEGGVITNFGVLDSSATSSIVAAAFGDGSQVINAGQVTTSGGDTAAVRVLGEGASALNRGEILVTGADSVGLQGVIADTHLTNQGLISVIGDVSWGMQGGGNGHQATNSGLIETQGTFAAGIVMNGRGGPLNEPGSNFGVVNTGRITTDGDLAIGVALGLGGDGFNNAVDGQIVNSGVIETVGDGAAGIVMIGDSHHLTNSGRITTDGGAVVGPPVDLHAAGVLVSGDGVLVENTLTGVIESLNEDSAAVELNVLERPGLPAAMSSASMFTASTATIFNFSANVSGDGGFTSSLSGTVSIDTSTGTVEQWNIGSPDFAAWTGTPTLTIGLVFTSLEGGNSALEALVISYEDVISPPFDFIGFTGPAVGEGNIIGLPGFSQHCSGGCQVTDATLSLSEVPLSATLENFGRIEGADVAVLGGAFEEEVINHGRIVGDVNLGGGNDTFVFGEGGVLTGDLFLGEGADLVVVENGSGITEVADFVAGDASGDAINVSAFFSDFGEVQDAMQQNISGDVVIALDSDDTLILTGVQLGALNAHDFIFVV